MPKLRDFRDALTQPSPQWVKSLTFTGDSGDTPIAVLLQDDSDIDATYCGHCHRQAWDWPYADNCPSFARPAAMYQSELYCADCFGFAYDDSGAIVRTLTGEAE